MCPRLPGRMVCLAERTPVVGPALAAAADAGPGAAPRRIALVQLRAGRPAVRLPHTVLDHRQRPSRSSTRSTPRNVERDLAAYRTHYRLPACTHANGCFKRSTRPARRPTAHPGRGLGRRNDARRGDGVRDLPELSHPARGSQERRPLRRPDLENAVLTATNLGARYVSMSWGGNETSTERSADAQVLRPIRVSPMSPLPATTTTRTARSGRRRTRTSSRSAAPRWSARAPPAGGPRPCGATATAPAPDRAARTSNHAPPGRRSHRSPPCASTGP